MTHRLFVIAASLAAVGIAPAANAQASASGAKPIARADLVRELTANYKNVDTNGDGAVVVSEIQAAEDRAQRALDAAYAKRRDAAFQKLDTNKDGQLSVAEFNAGSQPPHIQRAAPATILQQLDSNKDQKISSAEFGAITLANFDRVDLNHDGIVSLDEQQKARAARR